MGTPAICSISLHNSDVLRFHNFPLELYLGLRRTIQFSWLHGIQSERNFHSSKEIKLKGNPWSENWYPVHSTLLALRLLEYMALRGWSLLTATSVGMEFHTKDTWIFQFNGQFAMPGSMKLSALNFVRGDRIRVVDGPPSLVSIVQSTVQSCWSKGLQDLGAISGMPELKLKGYPWKSHAGENDELHRFLIALMSAVKAHGYTFLSSVRLTHTSASTTCDGFLPLDTWILICPSTPP